MIAKTNASCRPSRNGSVIRFGKKPRPVRAARSQARGCWSTCGADEPLDRVVAEERREQHRHGRQVADLRAPSAAGTPCASRPAASVCGQRSREPDDHQREEDPDREHLRRVLEGLVHARRRRRGPRAGRLFITPARFGEANAPIERPIRSRIAANTGYEKSIGSSSSSTNATAEREHPARREARASRSGRRGTRRAGPASRNPTVSGSMWIPAQSGVEREAVAVLGQPDPLQPDDQHEHQAAARDRGEEAREDAEGERADPEQRQPEHRVRDPRARSTTNATSSSSPDAEQPSRRTGSSSPSGCQPYGRMP